jgi:hypothetical protein
MTSTRLDLTRQQILGFRRRAGFLEERLPSGAKSLSQIASAGLQDSMPRAALLSINARMKETRSNTLDHPSLVQLWGPRFSTYVVAKSDRAIFTLGRLPDDPERRRIAQDLADRLEEFLDGARMPFGEAARALGAGHSLRYAAPTGRVLIQWDGARQPEIWTVPPPDTDPGDARLELARRHIHIFGPTTSEAFGRWAGIKPPRAVATFEALKGSLTPVGTPIGDGVILTSDEASIRSEPSPAPGVRLLPSGDAYYLLQGVDRELLVTNPDNRNALWTSRVWPGAASVDGEIVGTWRRSKTKVVIQPWRRLSSAVRDAVEHEATSLPIPDAEDNDISVTWESAIR